MTNRLAFALAEAKKAAVRGDIETRDEAVGLVGFLCLVPKREWPRRGARPEVWEAQKYVEGDPILRVFRDPKRRPLRKPKTK